MVARTATEGVAMAAGSVNVATSAVLETEHEMEAALAVMVEVVEEVVEEAVAEAGCSVEAWLAMSKLASEGAPKIARSDLRLAKSPRRLEQQLYQDASKTRASGCHFALCASG